jgi:hypothetical protein
MVSRSPIRELPECGFFTQGFENDLSNNFCPKFWDLEKPFSLEDTYRSTASGTHFNSSPPLELEDNLGDCNMGK